MKTQSKKWNNVRNGIGITRNKDVKEEKRNELKCFMFQMLFHNQPDDFIKCCIESDLCE